MRAATQPLEPAPALCAAFRACARTGLAGEMRRLKALRACPSLADACGPRSTPSDLDAALQLGHLVHGRSTRTEAKYWGACVRQWPPCPVAHTGGHPLNAEPDAKAFAGLRHHKHCCTSTPSPPHHMQARAPCLAVTVLWQLLAVACRPRCPRSQPALGRWPPWPGPDDADLGLVR